MIAPMATPLYIPKGKKWKGLTVFCGKCKTNVSDICKQTGKSLQRCPFGDRHTFKVYSYIPGTKIRKTTNLETTDVNEAIKLAIEFERKVKSQAGQVEIKPQNNAVTNTKEDAPHLVTHSLARFVGWLHGEGVPSHLKKERSLKFIKDIEKKLMLFAECMAVNGQSSLTMNELNDKTVGQFYDYLETKKYSSITFNKHFSYLTSWLKWYSEEYYPVRNWFSRVKRRKTNFNPKSISQEEFEALLRITTPKNGIQKYEKGVKEERNFYRTWLKDAFRLGLETGRRREEIINCRFNGIVEDEHGPAYVKVEDYKVNRSQNRKTDEEKKYIYIPVTDSLRELLYELGYEKYTGTDNFILAPEEKMQRGKAMCDTISRGFAHYYKQLNSGRNLSFKNLRKTYISQLTVFMGGNAKAITRHSSDEVIEQHYLDKEILVKAARGFSVFGKETHRKNELNQIRNNESQTQKLEVEK